MRLLALLLLAAVELGGVFGGAEVSGRDLSATRMEIEIEVEVAEGAGGSVVVHLVEPGGAQQTVALRERAPGRYGGFAEVRRIDYVAVFEVLDDGAGSVSDPVRLTDIGLDPTLVGLAPVVTPPPSEEETALSVGWLALGVGAGALALGLVVFALLPREEA